MAIKFHIFKLLLFLQTTFRDMKKTGNLEAYVQWFNRLSYMVASEISSVSFTSFCMFYTERYQMLKLNIL